jgi:hypothetical protein
MAAAAAAAAAHGSDSSSDATAVAGGAAAATPAGVRRRRSSVCARVSVYGRAMRWRTLACVCVCVCVCAHVGLPAAMQSRLATHQGHCCCSHGCVHRGGLAVQVAGGCSHQGVVVRGGQGPRSVHACLFCVRGLRFGHHQAQTGA